MALGTPVTTPATVRKWSDGEASYNFVLAHAGGTVPVTVGSTWSIFPDGVSTGTAANAIASGTVDATGATGAVPLFRGCIYQIITNDGSFTGARFMAGYCVGDLLVPGDNVSGTFIP